MITRILLFVFLICSIIYGQNKLIVSFNPGTYLSNSENSIHITDDNKIRWVSGLSLAFEKENVWGYNVHMEYNFNYSDRLRMVEFTPYPNDSPDPTPNYYANYFLTSHNYDISLVFKLSDNFNYYFGPSLAVYNRTAEFNVSNYPAGEIAPNLYDKLVSFCIGLNGAVNFELPLSEGNNHFLLYSGLKMRYLHSIFFDKRSRDVSNYSQSFLTAQLNLGIGYNF